MVSLVNRVLHTFKDGLTVTFRRVGVTEYYNALKNLSKYEEDPEYQRCNAEIMRYQSIMKVTPQQWGEATPEQQEVFAKMLTPEQLADMWKCLRFIGECNIAGDTEFRQFMMAHAESIKDGDYILDEKEAGLYVDSLPSSVLVELLTNVIRPSIEKNSQSQS